MKQETQGYSHGTTDHKAGKLPWFRFYTEAVDDEKLRLLAFEDRWHFVALLCCKGSGLLDAGDEPALLRRKLGVKLGLASRELDEAVRRLAEVGLIDEATFQPTAWHGRQMRSDVDSTNAERQRRFRERKSAQPLCNALVTRLDTDTEKDSEQEQEQKSAAATREHSPAVASLPITGNREAVVTEADLDHLRKAYPQADIPAALARMAAWLHANPKRRPTAGGVMRFVNAWLGRDADRVAAGKGTTDNPRESLVARVERLNNERQARDDARAAGGVL